MIKAQGGIFGWVGDVRRALLAALSRSPSRRVREQSHAWSTTWP